MSRRLIVQNRALRQSSIKRGRAERGAVLVEASIAMTVLLIVMGGILNYGVLFGDTNDLSGSTRSAALAGSATGFPVNNGYGKVVGDSVIIRAVTEQVGGKADNIKKIVVYRANGTMGGPTDACKASNVGIVDYCNVYTPNTFNWGDGALSSSAHGQGWKVGDREAGKDFLGVWVYAEEKPALGWIWSPESYSDFFVIRMAPPVSTSGSSDTWEPADYPRPVIGFDNNGCKDGLFWGGSCGDPDNPGGGPIPPGDGGGQ